VQVDDQDASARQQAELLQQLSHLQIREVVQKQ
jgi:hypothetical protein